MRCACAARPSARTERRRAAVDIVAHAVGRRRHGGAASPAPGCTRHGGRDPGAGRRSRRPAPAADRLLVAVRAGSFADVRAYAIAVPGELPPLPPLVGCCRTPALRHAQPVRRRRRHAAALAGATLAVAAAARLVVAHRDRCLHAFGRLLPGPALYPITERGFDGVAWNTPWALRSTISRWPLSACGSCSRAGTGVFLDNWSGRGRRLTSRP